MQTLWSRAKNAKCTCRCLLCLNAARFGLSRRATTAAEHRQLKWRDAVTVAYMTIFAGGVITDKNRKDAKRAEWDRKIAEVKEEVERLKKKNEERPLGSTVQKRLLGNGSVGQRRLYSTSQAFAFLGDDEEGAVFSHTKSSSTQIGNANDYFRESAGASNSPDPRAASDTVASPRRIDDRSITAEGDDSTLSDHESLRLQVIRALSVKRLALKLVLRPSIVQSYGQPESWNSHGNVPEISNTYLEGAFGKDTATNVQGLLAELAQIKATMGLVKFGKLDNAALEDLLGSVRQNTAGIGSIQSDSERDRLDTDLSNLFQDFHRARFNLEKLLFGIARNLLQSDEPPETTTYLTLIRGFTRARQNDLVHVILESLRESRRFLSSDVIVAALQFYTMTKDLLSFDKLLTWLTTVRESKNFDSWKKIMVGTKAIAVPPAKDAKILEVLIYGALRFDQPHRAQMWYAALGKYGLQNKPDALTSFIKYYALTCNWDLGRAALEKAMDQLRRGKFAKGDRVDRMVFWMLHLCLSCEQVEPYRRLIKFAVENEFNYSIAHRYRMSRHTNTIMVDWIDARNTYSHPPTKRLPDEAEGNHDRVSFVPLEELKEPGPNNPAFLPRSSTQNDFDDQKAAYAADRDVLRETDYIYRSLSKAPRWTPAISTGQSLKEAMESMLPPPNPPRAPATVHSPLQEQDLESEFKNLESIVVPVDEGLLAPDQHSYQFPPHQPSSQAESGTRSSVVESPFSASYPTNPQTPHSEDKAEDYLHSSVATSVLHYSLDSKTFAPRTLSTSSTSPAPDHSVVQEQLLTPPGPSTGPKNTIPAAKCATTKGYTFTPRINKVFHTFDDNYVPQTRKTS